MTKPRRINPQKCIEMKESGMTWRAIGVKTGFNPSSIAMSVKSYKEKLEKYLKPETKETPPPEILDDVMDEKEKKTHPPTKPWDASDNPWSLDLLRLTKKRKGFVPRWVSRDNLQAKTDQGWTFADAKDYGGTYAKLPGEEGKLDSTVRRRELVLMEMPEELMAQRQEFHKKKTDQRSVSARDIVATEAAKMKKAGVDVELLDEGTPLRERINQMRRVIP